jgi:hypothetical protein
MFTRLHTYTVHLGPKPEDAVEMIREGFSLWAFLFGALWLGYYRAWRPAAGLLLFGLAYYGLEAQLLMDASLLAAVQFGVQLWAGFEGADWRRAALMRRGYRMVDVICETTEERALLRYYVDTPTRASLA